MTSDETTQTIIFSATRTRMDRGTHRYSPEGTDLWDDTWGAKIAGRMELNDPIYYDEQARASEQIGVMDRRQFVLPSGTRKHFLGGKVEADKNESNRKPQVRMASAKSCGQVHGLNSIIKEP